LLLYSLSLQAQNAPNTSTSPSATAATLPGPYINPALNYIRTWQPSMQTADAAVVANSVRSIKEVKQETQYFVNR
jgi:hypothetical protein